jgi:hypothetical protein
VRDEPERAGFAEGRDSGAGDAGQGEQCGFDLGGFHPVSADLQLLVDTAEEVVGTTAPPRAATAPM